MKLGEFLKPNIIKAIVAVVLGIITFLAGIFWLSNPIFFKTGCAPNPGCPYCEICISWGFPEILNFKAFILIIPLYLIACFIVQIYRKTKGL